MARRFDAVDAWMTLLVIIWGTAFVSITVLGRRLDPFQVTFYRYLPFLFLFGAWLLWRRRDRFRRVSGGDWMRFAIAGHLGVMGYHLPLNWAMSSLTPGTAIGPPTAAIIVATTPLWTLLIAVAMGQERFSPAKLGGFVAAFIGVILVVLRGTTQSAGFDVEVKAVIAVLAPILWGTYSLVAKPLITRYGSMFVTGITMIIGTLAFLPMAIHQGTAGFQGFTRLDWFWLIYLSLLATVAGYTIWNQALKRRSASDVTVYIFAVPVVATLASVLLIDEMVTPWFLLGAALVLGGLWTIHRARLAATAPVVPAADG